MDAKFIIKLHYIYIKNMEKNKKIIHIIIRIKLTHY